MKWIIVSVFLLLLHPPIGIAATEDQPAADLLQEQLRKEDSAILAKAVRERGDASRGVVWRRGAAAQCPSVHEAPGGLVVW